MRGFNELKPIFSFYLLLDEKLAVGRPDFNTLVISIVLITSFRSPSQSTGSTPLQHLFSESQTRFQPVWGVNMRLENIVFKNLNI